MVGPQSINAYFVQKHRLASCSSCAHFRLYTFMVPRPQCARSTFAPRFGHGASAHPECFCPGEVTSSDAEGMHIGYLFVDLLCQFPPDHTSFFFFHLFCLVSSSTHGSEVEIGISPLLRTNVVTSLPEPTCKMIILKRERPLPTTCLNWNWMDCRQGAITGLHQSSLIRKVCDGLHITWSI